MIKGLYGCLQTDEMPESGEDCQFCQYREAVGEKIGLCIKEHLMEVALEI